MGRYADVSTYNDLIIAVKTDKIGTLFVDFSIDGVNADSTIEFDVANGINEVHRLRITRSHARIRFTNTDSTNQTIFRLQTHVTEATGTNTAPLNQLVQQDADALVARTIDAEISIAQGLFSGYSNVNKFGNNPSIDSGTVPEDIWGGGGIYTGWATAAETLQVFSSSVDDTSAGSGARTIRIIGLDANYNVIQETVTLNGTTPVTTLQSFLRAHTAAVLTSGSTNTAFNAGTITIRQSTTTANVMITMLPGTNQTNCSAYTIPAGFTGYLRHVHSAIRSNATAAITGAMYIRQFGAAPRLRRPYFVGSNSPLNDSIYGGLQLPEKTDIVMRVSTCSANNVEITGDYDLILVED